MLKEQKILAAKADGCTCHPATITVWARDQPDASVLLLHEEGCPLENPPRPAGSPTDIEEIKRILIALVERIGAIEEYVAGLDPDIGYLDFLPKGKMSIHPSGLSKEITESSRLRHPSVNSARRKRW